MNKQSSRCNVRRVSPGGAVQVPERHQQPAGRAWLAPQQSQEVHRRQEPGPGLRTGRTGASVCGRCTCSLSVRVIVVSLIFVCPPPPLELLRLAPPGAEGVLQAAVRPALPGMQSYPRLFIYLFTISLLHCRPEMSQIEQRRQWVSEGASAARKPADQINKK